VVRHTGQVGELPLTDSIKRRAEQPSLYTQHQWYTTGQADLTYDTP